MASSLLAGSAGPRLEGPPRPDSPGPAARGGISFRPAQVL